MILHVSRSCGTPVGVLHCGLPGRAEIVVFDDGEVTVGASDRQSEQVAQCSDVTAGRLGLIEDPVLADGQGEMPSCLPIHHGVTDVVVVALR